MLSRSSFFIINTSIINPYAINGYSEVFLRKVIEMKKIYLLVAVATIVLAFTGCSGSDTVAVGGGTVDISVTYVAGIYFDGVSTSYAAVWKNGVRTNLTIDYTATGIFVTDSNVYITGYYGGGSVRPFYWKDGTKTALSSTYDGQTSGVVVDSGGVVYISGYMDISGYTPGYWKDGTWNALELNASPAAYTGRTSCIAVDSTYVYVGGYQTDDDTGYDVGTVWIYNKSTGVKVAALTFADPANHEASYVKAVFVKSGIVYAAGTKSYHMGGAEDYYPTYWTCTYTSSWNTVETLMMAVSASDQVTSIVVDSSDNVIVGGRNADQPTIWRSDNNSGNGGWDSPLKTTTDGSVNGLYLSGSDLYSGGFYNDATTNSNAFSANGTTVTDLITTSTGDYGVGYAIFVKQ